MINNIFLPFEINKNIFGIKYYIFQYRTKEMEYLSIQGISSKKIIINKQEKKIWPDNVSSQKEFLKRNVPEIEEKVLVIPDNLVINRKIIIPQADKETIRKIIPYEIGSSLPFDINRSYYDFFVINNNEKKCTVWCSFILKDQLDSYLEPIDIKNKKIVTSLPAIHSVVEDLNIRGSFLIAYENYDIVNLLIYKDNILNDVYSVNKKNLENTLNKLNLDIDFYCFNDLEHVNNFKFKCLNLNKLNNIVENKTNQKIDPIFLGVALFKRYIFDYNIIKSNKPSNETLSQIYTIITLSFLFITILIANIFFQRYRFKKTVEASGKEIKSILSKNGIISKKKNIPLIIKDAQKIISDQESIWFAFSEQKRFSFLFYLSELSNKINAKSLGLDIKRLTMNPNIINLTGQVKDYQDLQYLEDQINESLYFRTVNPLQETSFNLNIRVSSIGDDK